MLQIVSLITFKAITRWSKLYDISQTTAKYFRKLSLLPTHLIKKDTFSWIWGSSI